MKKTSNNSNSRVTKKALMNAFKDVNAILVTGAIVFFIAAVFAIVHMRLLMGASFWIMTIASLMVLLARMDKTDDKKKRLSKKAALKDAFNAGREYEVEFKGGLDVMMNWEHDFDIWYKKTYNNKSKI